MLNFEGKKVLITGAAGGIGSVVAKEFSKQGAVVILSGTSNEDEKLKKLSSELSNKSYIYTCNLLNEQETVELFNKADEETGGIDVLVCNAGITKDGLAMRMKNEDFELVLNINLRATFILTREAIKRMMKRRYGRIINIASIVGVTGNPGQANYSASKAGIIAMSKSIAAEVASRGITVNCIAPGFIETPMTAVLTEEQKNAMVSRIPVGKMGMPLDVANGILFLASEEAAYITGQTLHINGGMAMI
jgi:3-oxoacyl-[acyl-carrier protein] reductase